MANRNYDPLWNSPDGQYHRGDAPFQFPWWAIVLGFFFFPPSILAMIFYNIYVENTRPDRKKTGGYPAPPPYKAEAPKADTAKTGSARKGGLAGIAAARQALADNSERTARILLIVGLVLASVGALSAAEPLGYFITDLMEGYSAWYWLEDIFTSLAMMGGGIGCLIGSWFTRTNARMRKKIAAIVGKADYMPIRDIAAAIPCSYEKCCKHLENCIDKGLFGADAYLDMRTKCLVVRGPAPAEAPAPQPAPAAKPEPAPANAQADPYQAILQELRRVNDAIPGAEMSNKISRLEQVSARIFQQASSNPEKLPQMRKFMDYYLPTSLKLLRTYAELDAQGVEGENIRLSKQRIEQSMDTVVTAFENQLDQLFSADAMDVSADIEVMENMLRADGLAGDAPKAPQSPHLQL